MNPGRPSAQPAPTALQGVSFIPCVSSFAEAATLHHRHYAEAGFITPILKRGTEAQRGSGFATPTWLVTAV